MERLKVERIEGCVHVVVESNDLLAVWAEAIATNNDGLASLLIRFVETLGITIRMSK